MGMLQIGNTIKEILEQSKDLVYIIRKFDEYNERYFNGELPKIEMEVNNELGKIWGRFVYYTQLEEKMITPLKIQLNMKELRDEQVFRNVLIHEMVHYWDCINNPPSVEEWEKANEIRETQEHFVAAHADNEQIRLAYWNTINIVLGLHTDNDHSPKFKEKCHELNEKFTELNLSECVFGPKL